MTKKITLDFIGVGAEKSGTTWLADMLRQHHQIYIPEQKELHYFNDKFVEDPNVENFNSKKDISWYLNFFENANDDQIKGEFSPSYLWSEGAAEKIHELFPNIKIIAILRNPSDRTYSQYLYYYQKGVIREEKILKALQKHDYLIDRSLYYKQIKKYIDIFGIDQVKVFLFEDLEKNKKKFLESVEDMLGIEDWIPVNIDEKSNVTGVPKNITINRLLGQARIYFRRIGFNWIFDILRAVGLAEKIEKFRNNNKKTYKTKPELKAYERKYLLDKFEKDTCGLESLLGINLSTWKK